MISVITRKEHNYVLYKWCRRMNTNDHAALQNIIRLTAEFRLCSAEHNRKNWQISATKNGAEASGILYSIAETARANVLRPYYYFKYVLETMLPHMDDKNTDFLEELMPWSGSLPAVCRAKEK